MSDIDIRSSFTDKFILLLSKEFSNEDLTTISTHLSEFLSDWDVSPRETELTVYNGYIPHWMDEYFISLVVKGCGESSIYNYKLVLNEFFEFLKLPPQDICESDVQKYIAWCMRVKGNKGCTIDRKRINLNEFFGWSVKKGYLNNNPVDGIRSIKHSRTNRVPYTDSEIAKIRREAKTLRDKAIIETFISTGCRVAELSNLDITDIDFDMKTVRLFGKGKKYRTAFMTSDMEYAIKQYLESRTDDTPYLFITLRKYSDGYHRVSTRDIQRMMEKLSDDIGIEKIQPHRFRRYVATKSIKHGMSMNSLQKLLGHSSVSTTQRYIYTDTNDLKEEFFRYN